MEENTQTHTTQTNPKEIKEPKCLNITTKERRKRRRRIGDKINLV
jgi:hypothetical protein